MRHCWGTVLALLSFAAGPARADSKTKLVVMPLQASGLPASSVTILDELVADFVRRLGEHQVIGKSDIDAMLGLENMKDQLGCDDVSCAAEIGGALGAERLLAGRVAKLGSNIIIVLKLIDASKQQVLNSVQHKATDDENRYDEAVRDAVQKLFGLSAPAVTQATGGPPGSVRVASDVVGQIHLDGKATGFSTPYLLTGVSAGEHTVRVRSLERWGERSFRLDPGQTLDLTVDVNRTYEGVGAVRVTSAVSDVSVAVDGKLVGNAPQLIEGLTAGEHRITFTPPPGSHLLSSEQTVRVVPEEIASIDAVLRERGRLRINAGFTERFTPAGCSPMNSSGILVVDDEPVGAACDKELTWMYMGPGLEALWAHHPRFGTRVRAGYLVGVGTMEFGESPPEEVKNTDWVKSYYYGSVGEQFYLVPQDEPGSGLGLTLSADLELGRTGGVTHLTALGALSLRFGWFFLDAGIGPRLYAGSAEQRVGQVCDVGDTVCIEGGAGGAPGNVESDFGPWMASFAMGAELWF